MVRRALACLFPLLAACTDLPAIDAGVCGNAVIDEHEDCDQFAWNQDGVCRAKGSVGECHLDCRVQSNGQRGACPGGWGCDRDGLCRAPSGGFDAAVTLPFASATHLSSGDFDGDGRADLVSREANDAYQRAKPSVLYFDADATLVDARSFPKLISAPVIGDLNADARADFVFTNLRVGVLLGRSDRSWVPETFSSYRIKDAPIRIVGVTERDVVSNDSPIVALTTLGGETGIFIPTPQATLGLAVPLPAPIDALVGDPRTANIVEGESSPALELVLAYRGDDGFSFYDVCDADAVSGLPIWKTSVIEQRVELKPQAPIDTAPLLADMNGDGHIDALIGAGGIAYVAYGDGQHLATAVPFTLKGEMNEDRFIPMPIAVGEFSGDHRPDFVFPGGVFASWKNDFNGSGFAGYGLAQGNPGAPWTEAVIADLNGNGFPDILAAADSGQNLAFFNGQGSAFLPGATVSTAGPVGHLAVGDFDGDLLNDVAFIERALSSSDADSLRIAYGSPSGPPGAPITVAHVDAAEHVSAFADAGFSSLTVSSTVTRDGVRNGELTLLEGSPDRLPIALHTLVSLGDESSVVSSAALAISVGAFTAPGQHDLLALATVNPEAGYEYWSLPSIENNSSAPIKLSSVPDARIDPVPIYAPMERHVAVASGAADLDGDGLDESIWLAPSVDGGCFLTWLNLDLPSKRVVPRGALRLSELCDAPELLPVDADADGAIDLAMLLADSLLVLWNNGRGAFDAQRATRVSLNGEAPRAFSVLPRAAATMRSPRRAFTLTLVGEHSLSLAAFDGRSIQKPEELLSLERGTGVAAADFNGDGVFDLAVADAGKIRVLKGQLVPP